MLRRMRRRAACVVALVLLSACAPARRYPARAPTEAEIRVLEQAVKPLFEGLDPATRAAIRNCPIGLVIIPLPAINAATWLGDAGRCPPFTLGVTEGMLRRLSPDMLRAVLAHELGHIQLGHLEARRQRGAKPAIFRPLTAAFDRRVDDGGPDRLPDVPGSIPRLPFHFKWESAKRVGQSAGILGLAEAAGGARSPAFAEILKKKGPRAEARGPGFALVATPTADVAGRSRTRRGRCRAGSNWRALGLRSPA